MMRSSQMRNSEMRSSRTCPSKNKMVLHIKIALDVMFTISNTILLLLPSRDSLGNFAIWYCQDPKHGCPWNRRADCCRHQDWPHYLSSYVSVPFKFWRTHKVLCYHFLGRLVSHLPVDEHTEIKQLHTLLYTIPFLVWCLGSIKKLYGG